MKYCCKKSTSSANDSRSNRETSRTSSLAIINSIMNDEQFAVNFFFVVMRPFMTALADSYNRSANLELETNDICCMSYNACKENNWYRLRACKGETTPYAWISMITRQIVPQVLRNERFIMVKAKNTPNDYRLSMLGIRDPYLRQAIVDIVKNPEHHKALELYYVKKDTESALINTFGSIEKAKAVLKSAEKSLISQLLNHEEYTCYANIALSLKRNIRQEVPFQSWHDKTDENDECENILALREILKEQYGNEDWDKNLTLLVDSIITKLGWNDEKKTVWKERFFNGTPSKELAEQFDVNFTWIDNTYSRCNAQFRIALKEWWNKYNG